MKFTYFRTNKRRIELDTGNKIIRKIQTYFMAFSLLYIVKFEFGHRIRQQYKWQFYPIDGKPFCRCENQFVHYALHFWGQIIVIWLKISTKCLWWHLGKCSRKIRDLNRAPVGFGAISFIHWEIFETLLRTFGMIRTIFTASFMVRDRFYLIRNSQTRSTLLRYRSIEATNLIKFSFCWFVRLIWRNKPSTCSTFYLIFLEFIMVDLHKISVHFHKIYVWHYSADNARTSHMCFFILNFRFNSISVRWE